MLKFVSIGKVRRARSVLELHESDEVSMSKVSGTRSMFNLHESRDGDLEVDLKSEKLKVERGTVAEILRETSKKLLFYNKLFSQE